MSEVSEIESHNNQLDLTELPKYTRGQLAEYNGVDRPEIYVAIRGYIYDVTANGKSYGPGKGYHRLVGKDVSRLLGMNVLELQPGQAESDQLTDTTWYVDDLGDTENDIIDKWGLFFRKRYEIVGIVDHEQ